METAIETQGLTRHFGDVRAVNGIDLHVPQGSVFGFLGPNGSGKTTTIRLLLGLIHADAGSVQINGFDIRTQRSAALAKVGAIVENPALYPNLTGREVLRITAVLLKLDTLEIDRVLEIVDLQKPADRRVRGYSLGMRQRLALARALMGNPKLLMLDEPTNGLDPAGIADMRRLIKTLPEQSGTTVFVSSHQLSEMEQMTDHVALIKSGGLLFQGRLDTLMAQTQAELVIETAQIGAALATATSAGLDATAGVDGIVVASPMDVTARAALISALVGAGCSVSQARMVEPSLEQLFLTLTSDPLIPSDRLETVS
ncbi:MAG: ABC transporter ATP-binding protein [Litorimonas sp.]